MSTAPAPLIGITTDSPASPDRADLDWLHSRIVQAVATGGGLPVVIPPGLAGAALRGLGRADRLDGVVLPGGGDVDPARYGAPPHPAAGGLDPARDEAELALAGWAVADGRPLLGICRGTQVLNVALGGTLYGDVGDHPGAARHAFSPGLPMDLLAHSVAVVGGTRLAWVLGASEVPVNSLHHQACRSLAPGLLAAAWSPDGLVEAVEAPGHPFAVAVQWHPECLAPGLPMQHLFAALVEAAGRVATSASS